MFEGRDKSKQIISAVITAIRSGDYEAAKTALEEKSSYTTEEKPVTGLSELDRYCGAHGKKSQRIFYEIFHESYTTSFEEIKEWQKAQSFEKNLALYRNLIDALKVPEVKQQFKQFVLWSISSLEKTFVELASGCANSGLEKFKKIPFSIRIVEFLSQIKTGLETRENIDKPRDVEKRKEDISKLIKRFNERIEKSVAEEKPAVSSTTSSTLSSTPPVSSLMPQTEASGSSPESETRVIDKSKEGGASFPASSSSSTTSTKSTEEPKQEEPKKEEKKKDESPIRDRAESSVSARHSASKSLSTGFSIKTYATEVKTSKSHENDVPRIKSILTDEVKSEEVINKLFNLNLYGARIQKEDEQLQHLYDVLRAGSTYGIKGQEDKAQYLLNRKDEIIAKLGSQFVFDKTKPDFSKKLSYFKIVHLINHALFWLGQRSTAVDNNPDVKTLWFLICDKALNGKALSASDIDLVKELSSTLGGEENFEKILQKEIAQSLKTSSFTQDQLDSISAILASQELTIAANHVKKFLKEKDIAEKKEKADFALNTFVNEILVSDEQKITVQLNALASNNTLRPIIDKYSKAKYLTLHDESWQETYYHYLKAYFLQRYPFADTGRKTSYHVPEIATYGQLYKKLLIASSINAAAFTNKVEKKEAEINKLTKQIDAATEELNALDQSLEELSAEGNKEAKAGVEQAKTRIKVKIINPSIEKRVKLENEVKSSKEPIGYCSVLVEESARVVEELVIDQAGKYEGNRAEYKEEKGEKAPGGNALLATLLAIEEALSEAISKASKIKNDAVEAKHKAQEDISRYKGLSVGEEAKEAYAEATKLEEKQTAEIKRLTDRLIKIQNAKDQLPLDILIARAREIANARLDIVLGMLDETKENYKHINLVNYIERESTLRADINNYTEKEFKGASEEEGLKDYLSQFLTGKYSLRNSGAIGRQDIIKAFLVYKNAFAAYGAEKEIQQEKEKQIAEDNPFTGDLIIRGIERADHEEKVKKKQKEASQYVKYFLQLTQPIELIMEALIIQGAQRYNTANVGLEDGNEARGTEFLKSLSYMEEELSKIDTATPSYAERNVKERLKEITAAKEGLPQAIHAVRKAKEEEKKREADKLAQLAKEKEEQQKAEEKRKQKEKEIANYVKVEAEKTAETVESMRKKLLQRESVLSSEDKKEETAKSTKAEEMERLKALIVIPRKSNIESFIEASSLFEDDKTKEINALRLDIGDPRAWPQDKVEAQALQIYANSIANECTALFKKQMDLLEKNKTRLGKVMAPPFDPRVTGVFFMGGEKLESDRADFRKKFMSDTEGANAIVGQPEKRYFKSKQLAISEVEGKALATANKNKEESLQILNALVTRGEKKLADLEKTIKGTDSTSALMVQIKQAKQKVEEAKHASDQCDDAKKKLEEEVEALDKEEKGQREGIRKKFNLSSDAALREELMTKQRVLEERKKENTRLVKNFTELKQQARALETKFIDTDKEIRRLSKELENVRLKLSDPEVTITDEKENKDIYAVKSNIRTKDTYAYAFEEQDKYCVGLIQENIALLESATERLKEALAEQKITLEEKDEAKNFEIRAEESESLENKKLYEYASRENYYEHLRDKLASHLKIEVDRDNAALEKEYERLISVSALNATGDAIGWGELLIAKRKEVKTQGVLKGGTSSFEYAASLLYKESLTKMCEIARNQAKEREDKARENKAREKAKEESAKAAAAKTRAEAERKTEKPATKPEPSSGSASTESKERESKTADERFSPPSSPSHSKVSAEAKLLDEKMIDSFIDKKIGRGPSEDNITQEFKRYPELYVWFLNRAFVRDLDEVINTVARLEKEYNARIPKNPTDIIAIQKRETFESLLAQLRRFRAYADKDHRFTVMNWFDFDETSKAPLLSFSPKVKSGANGRSTHSYDAMKVRIEKEFEPMFIIPRDPDWNWDTPKSFDVVGVLKAFLEDKIRKKYEALQRIGVTIREIAERGISQSSVEGFNEKVREQKKQWGEVHREEILLASKMPRVSSLTVFRKTSGAGQTPTPPAGPATIPGESPAPSS